MAESETNTTQLRDEGESRADTEHIRIFVNRRPFGPDAGVRGHMTGAQIAALVEVPADKAVIRREYTDRQEEISVSETISIHAGDHFLVTRATVEGGHRA